MKMIKRWGVMTLVALLVLGSMGAALADDATEVEKTKEPLAFGSESGPLEWAGNVVNFVFYWGLQASQAAPECQASGAGTGTFLPTPTVAPADCVQLNVEGPNGQVNHGSMVSAFVHWLKNGNAELLSDSLRDMPKGQLVSRFAQLDFGKGFFDGEDVSELDADQDDGRGPPDWVKEKKAAKAAAKGK